MTEMGTCAKTTEDKGLGFVVDLFQKIYSSQGHQAS
jgi:hypothetical protein